MLLHDAWHALQEWFASGRWLTWAGRLAIAAVIVGAGFLLARLYRSGVHRLRASFASGAPVAYVVEQLGAYAIVLAGLIAGAATLGIDLSSLALFGGALGVGVGLGLQGVVKEFVSGLVLIFDPTVEVGDFVELEDGTRGEVVEIGPRAVRLRTNDELNIVIPNSSFVQSRLTNWTYSDASRRIHVPFSVAEGSDVTQVREIALQAAKSLPFSLPEEGHHKTQVWLNGFAGKGLDFDLVVWPTLDSSRHPRTLHSAYTWAIYRALQKAGVRNAQDQLEVTLQEAKAAPARRAGRGSTQPDTTPNDAAAAVFDEADRRRSFKETPRTRKSPPRA